jgi:hypothetical protein
MKMRVTSVIASLALAACSKSGAVGAGWSRAPDVSVYAAMVQAGELAREREVLCAGANPATVADGWQARFGAREAWIADALAARYGQAPLARARIQPVGREDCPAIADHRWRDAHADLLRLLELRLYPRSWWEQAALEGER